MTMRELVLEVLSESVVRRINFRYRTIPGYSSGLASVARGIRRGHIRVGRLRGDRAGLYTVDYDLISIRRSSDKSMRATALHEATHALQDYHRTPLLALEAEGAAYVAEGFYRVLKARESGDGSWTNPPPPRRTRLAGLVAPPDPHIQTVHRIAVEVATTILDTAGGYQVDDHNAQRIEDELGRSRVYSQDIGVIEWFNGIRTRRHSTQRRQP
jgi:hypothetical protein